MISGACELAADEKYRVAAAHYEKANQIAREEGSDSSQIRSLKKAHAEMQEIVWQYPDTQAANRVLVDTRISFSAADVEQKLSVLGVKTKIEQLQPANIVQENSGQGLTEYAIASLSGVFDEFGSRVTGLLPRLDTKPNTAATLTVEQEPNNSTDPMQKNITSIEDDSLRTRTESGLATVALGTEEKNKVSDMTSSEAPLAVMTLPTKLPNKKPDNYHLFTKQKPKAETVQSVISPTGSINDASSSASAMQSLIEDAITTVASAPDQNTTEQVEPEKIALSTSNSGSAMETQGLSNDQAAQLTSDENNEPDIVNENIASSDSSQESELLDLAEKPKKSDGFDEVKVNVNLSNFYEPFLRFSILQSVSDDVDDWFDDSPSETYQSIDKSEISRMSGYSIAAGWRYKNYGLAYVYENHGERTKKDTGITTSIGSTDFTEDKFKTTVQLIELSKTWSLSEQLSAEVFGAIGEARREYILTKGLDGAGAWEVPGSIRTWEPASRIGVGLRHRVGESLHLSARFQASDYGRVALGGNALNLGENGFKNKADEISLGLEYSLGNQLKRKTANTSARMSEQTFNRYQPYFRMAALRQINADIDDWFDDSASDILTYVGSSSISPMKGVGFTVGIKRAPYFAAINFENHGEQTYRINNYYTDSETGNNTHYDIFKTTVRLLEFGRMWEWEAGNYYEIFIALGEAQRELIETGGDDSVGVWSVKGSVRTREPAWRIGAGQSYKLSGPLSIYGRLYYTDYGRVAPAGNSTNSGEWGFEHKSTEASIGLEYKL
jgi:hypothetical protein